MPVNLQPKRDHHYHFVTGKLAEAAVRDVVTKLAQEYSFSFSLGVMPITVAALMTPRWLRRHLDLPDEATHLIVPGYCDVGLDELSESLQIPVICGPRDCRQMGEIFGGEGAVTDLQAYDIEIIAEINHAPRLSIRQVVEQARRMREDGADVIDFGCDPVARCNTIGDYIAALRDDGQRVSVDTFDTWEAEQATLRGATLVLSVNSSNRDAAVDWGVEVVAIPDSPGDEKSFEKTLNFLDARGVKVRLDPILEPIGAGFARSLVRYARTRERYAGFEMMMGIGNLTELSDVDSAGVNLLLLGVCQENWRPKCTDDSSHQLGSHFHSRVRSCAPTGASQRIQSRAPKRLSDQLVMLRDVKLRPYTDEALQGLANSLKDNNYRLFAQNDVIHLLAAGCTCRTTIRFDCSRR